MIPQEFLTVSPTERVVVCAESPLEKSTESTERRALQCRRQGLRGRGICVSLLHESSSDGATMKLLKLVPAITLISSSPKKRDWEISAEKRRGGARITDLFTFES
jgi:hypothetical protein